MRRGIPVRWRVLFLLFVVSFVNYFLRNALSVAVPSIQDEFHYTNEEIGWILEMELPFQTLNFNPNSDTWGINFQRTVRRKNEDSIWMGWARNQGLRRMTNAGRVTGITNVSQGRGLDIKPYVLGLAEAAHGVGRQARVDLAQAQVVDQSSPLVNHVEHVQGLAVAAHLA